MPMIALSEFTVRRYELVTNTKVKPTSIVDGMWWINFPSKHVRELEKMYPHALGLEDALLICLADADRTAQGKAPVCA